MIIYFLFNIIHSLLNTHILKIHTSNNNFNSLPTMNDIQNQNLGNANFLPPNMQHQQYTQQQPTVNQNQAQNIIGNLPQGYTGDIPLELASKLPMFGGGQKKKNCTP